MTSQEYIEHLDRLISEVQAGLPAQALRIGSNQLALLKLRVINSGKKSDGESTGTYSETPVPAFFYKGKTTRKGSAYDELIDGIKSGTIGEKQGRDGDAGYYASYKEWRQVNNLPVDFKTYSFTGRTWQAVRPVLLLESPTRCIVGYRADGEEGEKVAYIKEMEPTIFDASESEKEIARRGTDEWITGLFNQILP